MYSIYHGVWDVHPVLHMVAHNLLFSHETGEALSLFNPDSGLIVIPKLSFVCSNENTRLAKRHAAHIYPA